MFGEPKFDYCRKCDCGEKRLIVNKTHYLCEEKNRERLDQNRQPRKRETLQVVKKSLRPTSKKSQKILSSYSKVCREIVDERGLRCESCGGTEYLSFSHLVPRSRRRDLIAEKLNIKIQCMTFEDKIGCHDKYELGKIDDFLDKEEILEIVKKLDREFYQLKFRKYE